MKKNKWFILAALIGLILSVCFILVGCGSGGCDLGSCQGCGSGMNIGC